MNKERKKDLKEESIEKIQQLKDLSRKIKQDWRLKEYVKGMKDYADNYGLSGGNDYGCKKGLGVIEYYRIKITPHLDENKRFIKLSKERVALLYDLLEEAGFIGGLYLKNYDKEKYGEKASTKDVFIWAFNYGEEPYVLAPIIWNKPKNCLRELFEFFIKPLEKKDRYLIEHVFCDKEGDFIQLNKRQGEYSNNYNTLEKIVKKILLFN